jgi:hypothetical protein
MSQRTRVVTLGIAMAVLAACEFDHPCDPGYYADHGACYLLDSGLPDAGGDLDSGASEADAAQVDRYAGFGKACTQSSECPASAPSCGAPMFAVCTVVNCLDKGADTCPPGWTCLDVKTLSTDPSVASVCVNF